MTRIIQGVFDFQKRIFGAKKSLFRQLAHGQQPLALFITCSDSRINPNLLTQTEPGELFILRNAGNIIPPQGGAAGGEAATVEYAVIALGVREIIVCGHAKCGAMHGLLEPHVLSRMPTVAEWLAHAQPVMGRMQPMHKELSPQAQLNWAIEQNVLLQLEHLRSYPYVVAAESAGKLRLHGWVYDFETGSVVANDPAKNRFTLLSEAARPRLVPDTQQAPVGEFDNRI